MEEMKTKVCSKCKRELLAELKARGYEWEKMYAPRQEVLYSKV